MAYETVTDDKVHIHTMNETIKMRGEGLETVRKMGGEGGWGVVHCLFRGFTLFYSTKKSDKKQDKTSLPQEPDFRLLGTAYIKTDKPSPGTPLSYAYLNYKLRSDRVHGCITYLWLVSSPYIFLASTSRPPDVIHVMDETRSSPFFTLFHFRVLY